MSVAYASEEGRMLVSAERTEWLRWLLLALACLVAFYNSLTGVFVFDDGRLIVENESIRQLWPLDFGFRAVNRPVLAFSLALNHATAGLDVRAYHIVNILIHLAAGLTLYALIRRTLLLPRMRNQFGGNAGWLAFVAALLWIVHPLQTASVTYIVQRSESLMGLFYLLCLYCYLRGTQSARGWRWFLASIACCWLGMATKQVMITAPVAALLYDRVFISQSWLEIVRRRWAVYAGYLPAVLWALYDVVVPFAGRFSEATTEMPSPQRGPSAGFEVHGIGAWAYLRSQPGVILHYLSLVFWPRDLCLDYIWPVATTIPQVVFPTVIMLAFLAASIVALKYRPGLGFLGLMFFLILVPTSSVLPIRDLAVEHRMYLPLAPVLMLAVLAGWYALRRIAAVLEWPPQKRTAVGALIVFVAAASLTARTIVRNRDYHSEVGMLVSILDVAPRNARVHNRLGMVLLQLGQREAAFGHLLAAKTLVESSDAGGGGLNRGDVYSNLGMLYAQAQLYEQAIEYFDTAIYWDAGDAVTHFNLGKAYFEMEAKNEQKDLVPARSEFERAISLEPEFGRAHFMLGSVAAEEKNYEEAVTHLRRAIELEPQNIAARLNLGLMLEKLGQTEQAAEEFRRILGMIPADSPQAHQIRAWLDKHAG